MRSVGFRAGLICAVSGLGLLTAATVGIGVAMSQGNITVNDSSSAGNATIFNGNTLATGAASSQVRLNDGAQLRLASESRGKIFTDHIDLQKGSADITNYSASAGGLRVRAEGKASASVSMLDKGMVQIASLNG